jgi:cytochrome P450
MRLTSPCMEPIFTQDSCGYHADSVSYSFAGSDTTAIAMRSIFYHLMKSPEIYTELIKEIDDATASGQLSSPPTFREASELPFFCATIKEAMRLHPSVGLTMPRITPAGGLEVAGTHIPAGYSIGMNAAVVGYNEEVYGPDAHTFQPKRWLGENAAAMNKHNLIFGAGTRTCIGKNVRSFPMRCQRRLRSLTFALPRRFPSVRSTSLFSSLCRSFASRLRIRPRLGRRMISGSTSRLAFW